MQTLLFDLPVGRAALLAAVPLFYLLAAAGSLVATGAVESRWRLARLCAAAAVGASVLSLAWLLTSGAGLARGPVLLVLGEFGALHLSLRSDALGALMLLLVSFIGWVIVGYSQPYLGGERGQPRYIRGLMLTLAAVTLLVVSNNLLLLALAWIATSLAFHGLLTFFDTRPQALVAAHKKFIASRVADLCLLAAIVLLGQNLGTLEIDQAIAAAKALPAMTVPLQAAALLLATSALLKCAQLPVHGWLIQVMEAPTPVSALLHAGVVNLGGFFAHPPGQPGRRCAGGTSAAGGDWKRYRGGGGAGDDDAHQHQGLAGLVDLRADGFHDDAVWPGPVRPGAAALGRPLAVQGLRFPRRR